jgi:FKBP-type peptidyl-prolyl cis-trans isomerase 2
VRGASSNSVEEFRSVVIFAAQAQRRGQARAEEAKREPSAAPEDANVIEDGTIASIEYQLTLDDGTEVDTNLGQEPLVYTQGEGQIMPDLEKEMVGLALGDTKTIKVSAEDGHGAPIRVHEVREDKIVLDFNHPLAGQALNFDVKVISVE